MEVTGSKFKFILKIIGGLVGFSIVGFLLIVISFLLPRKNIVANISESAENYYGYPHWAPGIEATMEDSFTDAIMLGSAGYNGKGNLLQSAVLINRYTFDKVESSPSKSLDMRFGKLEPTSEVKTESYPRYWHGYLVFLTPLLEILNPAEITFLNAMLVFSLGAILVAIAYKRYGIKLAACLGLFIVSLSPVSISLNFQYGTVFYPTVLALIAILLWDKWLQQKNRYWFFFLFLGCMTVYLDLLTYPLVSLGVPLALVMYLRNYNIKKIRDILPPLRIGILASFLWVLGYAGTWVLKWTISSIILKENMFSQAIEQMKFRVEGDFGRFDAIRMNFETMFNDPMKVFIGVLILIIIILLIARKIKLRWRKWDLIVYPVIAIFPLVWYFVLCNHSTIHHWFTYRELSITVFAVSLIVAGSIARRLPKGKKK